MFPESIETDSLTLEQLSEAHVDVFELYELFEAGGDDVDDVFEYVPQEPYATVKDARECLEKATTSWDEREAAQYALFTTDGDLAGFTGLFLEWERRTGRIGFILGKPFWGNGYAGECAHALTELTFDRLDLELVEIGYEEGNERSKSAIENASTRTTDSTTASSGTGRRWAMRLLTITATRSRENSTNDRRKKREFCRR
jgi:RimJ/RimL family protein N-acetyltransferase